MRYDLFESWCMGFDNFTSEEIGVDDGEIMVGE